MMMFNTEGLEHDISSWQLSKGDNCLQCIPIVLAAIYIDFDFLGSIKPSFVRILYASFAVNPILDSPVTAIIPCLMGYILLHTPM